MIPLWLTVGALIIFVILTILGKVNPCFWGHAYLYTGNAGIDKYDFVEYMDGKYVKRVGWKERQWREKQCQFCPEVIVKEIEQITTHTSNTFQDKEYVHGMLNLEKGKKWGDK